MTDLSNIYFPQENVQIPLEEYKIYYLKHADEEIINLFERLALLERNSPHKIDMEKTSCEWRLRK